MRRRGFLTSLLGLAVTPALAARVLAEQETLFSFPLIYGRALDPLPLPAAGGWLVPPAMREEILRMLALPPDVVDVRCRCVTLPPEEGT